jgi:Leucine Rich repeat
MTEPGTGANAAVLTVGCFVPGRFNAACRHLPLRGTLGSSARDTCEQQSCETLLQSVGGAANTSLPRCSCKPLDKRPILLDIGGMETSVKSSWRMHLHFRLRSLVALILLFGCGLGWWAFTARAQRDAVAAIRRAGGYVRYDWEWKDLEPITGGKPPRPRWIVDRIGDDYFGDVTYVHFDHNPNARDADFACLACLPRLEQLYLCDTDVTDAGLAHLTGLTQIRFLNLRRTNISDAGLGHLKPFTSLRSLLLGETRVTDAGLLHLKGLSSLEVLDLDRTDISDAGLVHLKGLSNLKQLHLTRTRVTNAGAAEFHKAIPKLEIIR